MGIGAVKGRAKELSYYFFFGLMVLAKGLGFDSGNRLYYLLSIIACICVGCKLVLTKYNYRQLGAMALLCVIAFVAYRNSGRLGIILTVLAVIGLKDMDIRKLFRLGLVVYGCAFALTVWMAKTGIRPNPLDVHVKGGTEVIRWGMGYSTGNIFHVSYFILTVFFCYTWEKRYGIKRFLLLMAGNFIVFLFSFSYTGIIVTTFYLILNFYAVKRKRLCMAERVVCQLPLPLCLIFSFAAPFLLDNPFVKELNNMLQARLAFSFYYLKNQPITLFGTRMKDVPNFWVIMDNGYVYIFMTFGIVAFVLFCAGYAMLIAKYSGIWGCRQKAGYGKKTGRSGIGEEEGDGGRFLEEEKLQELAIIFSFLLYGIMEQFISNAFMNLSLLFLGEALFGACRAERPMENKWGNRELGARQWICCGGIGCIAAAAYLVIVPATEFIKVPLDSLMYVDAWSAEIKVENGENTKEALKEVMNRCKLLTQQPEAVENAIRNAGLEGKLSVEDAVAAMEYSIPIPVQSSRNYDRFRVRMLELYCGMTEDEYGLFMTQLMQMAGGAEGSILEPENVSIYRERVWKSTGEDRIEHISGEKAYMVEKNGSIAKLEHLRSGIFYGVAASVVFVLLASLYPLITNRFYMGAIRHEK